MEKNGYASSTALMTHPTASGVLLENLTGGQIQKCLDFLILESLAPIIRNSSIFDTQVVYLLSMVTKNKKRKLSALPREEFISILCRYLATTDPDKKLEFLQQAKIERGFLYNFVVNVLKKLENFIPVYHENMLCVDSHESYRLQQKMKTMAASVGMSPERAFTVCNQSADYVELAYSFRNSIVNNYIKYAYKQAKIFCTSKSSNFDFQDVWHNFLAAVTKAIDKYDCSKGALTSYIKWWILNVQTSVTDHGHEYGIAYVIPQLHRKGLALKNPQNRVNFGVSLDCLLAGEDSTAVSELPISEGLEEQLAKTEANEEIRYLIKKADTRSGLARLYLDIDEHFSQKELDKMAQIMKMQGTHPEDTLDTKM